MSPQSPLAYVLVSGGNQVPYHSAPRLAKRSLRCTKQGLRRHQDHSGISCNSHNLPCPGALILSMLRGLLFRRGRFGFHRLLDGGLFRGLARPGVRRCRLRGFCGFIIWHTRLPPDFEHEKRGLIFHQAPVGWFLLSCQATKIPPVVSFGRYLCVRLAVHC